MATKQVNKPHGETTRPIIVAEVVKEEVSEEWFPRKKCNSCTTNNMIGIILLKDNNRLCFICYDLVKKLSGLSLDSIHEIDITAAKKYISDKTQEKK